MKKISYRVLPTILVCSAMVLTACSDEDNGVAVGLMARKSTSLFVATDRHETGSGNNLAMSVQTVASHDDVVIPHMVLLGGDYVGKGPDRGTTGQPAFSLNDMYAEIFSALSPTDTDILFTYGSHDQGCTDGYKAFFSGPHHCDGYYVYGISYAQMVFDTDSLTRAAVALYLEQGDNAGEDTEHSPGRDGEGQPEGEGEGQSGSGVPPAKPEEQGGLRAYNGIDVTDKFGISAESATASFTSWVSTLTDHEPIVVMTHVPMHAHRGDNPGGMRWFEALSHAAETHDVIVFYGHNHTLEEHGDSLDRNSYLLVPGDSISIQGDKIQGVQQRQLNFAYANAGYLKLGWSTLVTFFDTDGNGHHDHMLLRRFNVLGDDDSYFGLTGKRNPYILRLKR